MKSFSLEEISKHNTESDCWIIIRSGVFDVTNFLGEHPGGKKIILKVAGKDATKEFEKFHNADAILQKYSPRLKIGSVLSSPTASVSTHASKTESQTSLRTFKFIDDEKNNLFGEMVPYGDPQWYQGLPSPYYTEKHRKLRRFMREWTEKNIIPFVTEWDEAKRVPLEVFKIAAKDGILTAVVAAGWQACPPKPEWDVKFPADIPMEEWDGFCSLVVADEICRCGCGGFVWALIGGLGIGLPPIMKFGSDELKDRVIKSCIDGDKHICLAITEPSAGSDVGNITTTAVKSADGKHYIVNGEKKWITNGVFCEYFTVAVRTGGSGMNGISLLLIEKDMPGVTTKQMNCMGVWSSGTTYITFEDVKVPVQNLIGKENKGFKYIMYNFNYERIGICCQASRFSRVCYEEAYKYANKRKTFGQYLIQHPVIRWKLSEMARQIEAAHCYLEHLIKQLNDMEQEESFIKLGGSTALCKAQLTKTFEYCAREAAQIFGGLSYSRGGQGGKVERLYREVRAYAIPGGSEEIMLDLGIRQAKKVTEKTKEMVLQINSKL